MAQKTPKEIARALYAGGQLIELDAERSITAGSISGKGHIPSRPGEPPNADTRALDLSIETKVGGPALVTVEAGGPSAPYAAYLEYGTSRMAARPFMRPATEKNRAKVVKLVGDALNITIK